MDIFYSIPRKTILEKNLLRLLGVDVRCDTLGLWKNNLLDLFSNANQINDAGLGLEQKAATRNSNLSR